MGTVEACHPPKQLSSQHSSTYTPCSPQLPLAPYYWPWSAQCPRTMVMTTFRTSPQLTNAIMVNMSSAGMKVVLMMLLLFCNQMVLGWQLNSMSSFHSTEDGAQDNCMLM